jgi:metal-sulfur cluster biosynthetic enzyme
VELPFAVGVAQADGRRLDPGCDRQLANDGLQSLREVLRRKPFDRGIEFGRREPLACGRPAAHVLSDTRSKWLETKKTRTASSSTGRGAATLILMPTREEVIEALKVVEDPELGMDIVELGLLYDVAVDGSKVHVTYSLTSMGCPVGPMIEQQITETVAEMDGVENVESELTWDPPWSPEKMSDDAKFVLGFG